MKILITVCFLLIATGCPLCHAQSSGVEIEVEIDPASETAIKIFSLENADATECVSQLKELDPSAKVVADPRTNSVIVSSSDESQLRILEALLLRLDESPSKKKTLPADAEISAITVFRLQNVDVHEATIMLQILDGISEFKSNSSKNELTVVATKDRMERIQNFLERLDSKSTPRKPESGPSSKPHEGSDKPDSDSNRRSPLSILPTIDVPDHPEALQLLKLLSEKESTASALARKIRIGEQTPDVDSEAVAEARKNLVAVLREALDLKFQLEKLQLAALEERIASVKSRLAKRTSPKSIEQIVDRRSRELINGDDSRWTPNEFESAEVDPKSRESEKAKPKPTVGFSDEQAIRKSQDDVAADAPNDSSSASPIAGYRELSAELEKSIREEKDATFALMKLKSVLKHRSDTTSSDSTSEKQQTELELAMRRVESARLNRNSIQEEFSATIKDLEVLVEAAKVDVKGIERKKKRLEELHQKQVVSQSEVDEVRDKLKQAQFSLERLQIRLDLYQKAGESLQAYLSGSKIKRTDPPAQTKAVEEESSDANPNTFVRDGFSGNVASTTPKVPETYEQCAEILRTSTNAEQLLAAITTITKLRNSNSVPALQDTASLASSVLHFIAQKKMDLALELQQVFSVWNEFERPVRFAAILKSLRESNPKEQLVAVRYASPLTDFVDEPEFSNLCERLLTLGSSPDVELRRSALRVLVGTLPITKLNSSDFKSAERQEMVSRVKNAVPRLKVIELLRSAIGEVEIAPALTMAGIVAQSHESVDDEEIITKTIEVLFQIASRQYFDSAPSNYQRAVALSGLTLFQSRPKQIVPKLIELLKSDKSELLITAPLHLSRDNAFSKEAIINALIKFRTEARDAVPLLEDELVLVGIMNQEGSKEDRARLKFEAKRFLENAINQIKDPQEGRKPISVLPTY